MLQDGFKLSATIEGPTGPKTVKLDLEARPLEGNLEYTLKSGGTMDLNQLFLPSKDRKNGTVIKAGRVTKKRPFKTWQVWEAMGTVGGSGARHYDDTLGVLVGWVVSLPGKEAAAHLVQSQ